MYLTRAALTLFFSMFLTSCAGKIFFKRKESKVEPVTISQTAIVQKVDTIQLFVPVNDTIRTTTGLYTVKYDTIRNVVSLTQISYRPVVAETLKTYIPYLVPKPQEYDGGYNKAPGKEKSILDKITLKHLIIMIAVAGLLYVVARFLLRYFRYLL